MALTKFTSGVNTNFSTELNDNTAVLLEQQALNHINMLFDRSVKYSANQIGGWGEAYVDSNGRNNSVKLLRTNSLFDWENNDKFISQNCDTIDSDTTFKTEDTSKWQGENNPFRQKASGTAYYDANTTHDSGATIGKTFSARYINKVFYSCRHTSNDGGTEYNNITFETYNGSTWSTHTTIAPRTSTGDSGTKTGTITVNDTIQGVRIHFNPSGDNEDNYYFLYRLLYTWEDNTSEVSISHNIPTGTFIDTISSSIGVPLIDSYEDGCDIEYNLEIPVNSENINDTTTSGSNSTSTYNHNSYDCIGSTTPEVTAFLQTTNATRIVTGYITFYYLDGTNEIVSQSHTGDTISTQKTFTNPNPSKELDYIKSSVKYSTLDRSNIGTITNVAATITASATSESIGETSCISPNISSFTAFSNEPTTLTVKLTPKTTSPTAGYPSINGFYVMAK